MHNLNLPYIGITDFTHVNQVVIMRTVLNKAGCRHLLGVGVMMSYKTLKGLETKWAKAWPPKEAIADIFVQREGVLNVLHYADYDGETTANDLIEAIQWAGPGVDAVQLDMIWPSLQMLEDVKKSVFGQRVKFILQVNEKAIEQCDGNPAKVAEQLTHYRRINCLDYALFDLSMGKGKPLEATRLMSHIWKSIEATPDLAVAVAGGLGPTSMDLAAPIIRDLPDVSLDAQSKLRPSGSALDPIDWSSAAVYLREAANLIKQARRT